MPAGPTDQGRQTGRQLNASPAQPCKTDHPFVACRSKHKAYLACVHRSACDPFQRRIHDKVAAGSANKSGCLCLTRLARWPACDWNLLSSGRVLLGRASATATATSVQLSGGIGTTGAAASTCVHVLYGVPAIPSLPRVRKLLSARPACQGTVAQSFTWARSIGEPPSRARHSGIAV